MDLNNLGWNTFFEKYLNAIDQQGLDIGRICCENKISYKLFSEYGELTALISGKLRNSSNSREDLPAVGDWVVFKKVENENKAVIQHTLPRKSKFSRKTAGNITQEQILAANIDTVFIVSSLNYDFNPRRIERYLTMVWNNGANPVIILTKSDLYNDLDEILYQVESIAFGTRIHIISNVLNQGIDVLRQYLSAGSTVALIGSSGVGKSTLINKLIGEDLLITGELRKNIDKGMHTTTNRQLYVLPDGGLIIDTPGMRELQLWDVDDGLNQYFDDIENLAENCRYSNCKHDSEPGCAVKAAISKGLLDKNRYESYVKMKNELTFLSKKQNQKASQIEKEKWKNIHKQIRNFKKK
ncbi:MAG: ribosome small subunit-dependent GTPase A [Candidatus Gastranaerophilales bacterium]|nr:ribosome small subunit-dependent GTPase A [Candidatus Gastranaerophilales bacterium]